MSCLPITIDDDAAQTTTSEFDTRGQIVKTIFTDGSFVTMTYDDRGRKLTETNQMNQTRTFEYNLMGRLKSVTLPQLAGSTEAAKYLYSYDAEGRQTSLIDPLGRETTWEFDSQGRQVGSRRSGFRLTDHTFALIREGEAPAEQLTWISTTLITLVLRPVRDIRR